LSQPTLKNIHSGALLKKRIAEYSPAVDLVLKCLWQCQVMYCVPSQVKRDPGAFWQSWQYTRQ